MNKPFILVLGVVLLFSRERVSAQEKELTDSEIRQILQDCVDKQKRAPGIVVGFIGEQAGRIISYGKPSRDSTQEVNGNTVFEIGSVTKVFTALLLEKMIERGELKLDDPAGQFLPASVKLPSRNGQPITLRHLATHTSALPRLPDNLKPRDPDNPYADYTVEQLYAFLTKCKLDRDIGAKYEYSNLGMGLLGHILALKAGTNYEGLVLKEICEPLKMASTRITLPPELKARLATGHNTAGVPVKNWDLPTLAGAGALHSTVNDMLKFVAANLGGNDSPLSAVMEKTHVPQHNAGLPDTEVALAWHVRKKFGSEIVWHNGGTGGYHSFVGFDKQKRQGVVVLCNAGGDIDDIGWHLLNPRFKLKNDRARQVAEIDHRVYDAYVGRYEITPQAAFVITRDRDHLFAKLADQPTVEVYPESETEFFYTIVDAQLTFVIDKAGVVTHLVLHQNGIDQKAKKVK